MTLPFKSIIKDPSCLSYVGWAQLKYALWVNLTEVSIGLAYGFAAVTLPQITGRREDFTVTTQEGSWIGSVLYLSAPVGCLLCGCIMDKFGRRIAMLLCKVPLVMGWMCTGLASSGTQMILGGVIIGIGCGMGMSPPRVYIAEITLPNMRGVLSALCPLATTIGITLQVTLGLVVDWQVLSFLSAAYAGSLVVTDYFLPETPFFLLSQYDTVQQIQPALKKFRGNNYDDDEELNDMADFKDDNKIKKLSINETMSALFKPSACKPFVIILTYIFVAQMSGVTVIVMWTVEILNKSMSTVSSDLGDVIMTATRFSTGVVVAILLYKLGKKSLAFTSSLGVCLVCLSIFIFLKYTKEHHVYPQIAFIFYVIFATLGYHTLPFIIMAEVYPLQVRGILIGITLSFSSVLSFGVNKFFPCFCELISLQYVLLIFSIFSFLGCVFIYLYLPETTCLTLAEIEEYYNGYQPTLVSQRQVRSLQLSSSSQNSKNTREFSSDLMRTKSQLSLKNRKPIIRKPNTRVNISDCLLYLTSNESSRR